MSRSAALVQATVSDLQTARVLKLLREHEASEANAMRVAIELGGELRAIKDTLGHGQWLGWLKAHWPASVRRAQQYMEVAEEHPSELQVDTLDAAVEIVRERRRQQKIAQTRDLRVVTPVVETWQFHVGDCRQVLASLEPEFAQCVMTSPPFWGLRDYKIAPSVWGGDPEHTHVFGREIRAPWANDVPGPNTGGKNGAPNSTKIAGSFCQCGAWCGQLGLEPSPQLYVEHIVECFRWVRRALRKDGVLWLEIGDSYAGSGKGPSGWNGLGDQERRQGFVGGSQHSHTKLPFCEPGVKAKDLLGIPWRVAFALQEDGWYLRNDNIWARPNPMPESVKDRCTRAHSYVFQMSRSRKVYYDWEAIAEPVSGNAHSRGTGSSPKADIDEFVNPGQRHNSQKRLHRSPAARSSVMSATYPLNDLVEQRNKRSVWTVPTKPFPDAHFATFPPELCEDPIKATSRPGDVVLDPFSGAGTVALVAARLSRNSVGIDAKAEYVEMARERLAAAARGTNP